METSDPVQLSSADQSVPLASLKLPFIPPNDAPIKTVIEWSQYINKGHCGYCHGKSVAAVTKVRESSIIYGFTIDTEPVIKLPPELREGIDPTNPYSSSGSSTSGAVRNEYNDKPVNTLVRSMPVEAYSRLLNMGFRRSGKMFYKVDQRNSCCPQYTMRLDVNKYKPSKDHRKALSRFNRWVRGETETNLEEMSSSLWKSNELSQTYQKKKNTQQTPTKSQVPGKKPKTGSKNNNQEYNLHYQVHSVDADFDHIDPSDRENWSPADKRDLQLLPNDTTFKNAGSAYFHKTNDPDVTMPESKTSGKPSKLSKPAKANKNKPLLSTCRPSFRVCLKLAVPTREKYELFKKYQIAIHKEDEKDINGQSFARFLCQSPINEIKQEKISMKQLESKRPMKFASKIDPSLYDLYGNTEYTTIDDYIENNPELSLEDVERIGGGTFHQEYWYMGKLIAFGVLDIFPGNCVSSVYLVWDPDYPELELGKVSALREIALTKELQLPYYCLGLYVPSCSKMLYKSSFKPGELLDPMAGPEDMDEPQRWFPLDEFEKHWDQDGTHTDWYVSILKPDNQQDLKTPEKTVLAQETGMDVDDVKSSAKVYFYGLDKVMQELSLDELQMLAICKHISVDEMFVDNMPGITFPDQLNALLSTTDVTNTDADDDANISNDSVVSPLNGIDADTHPAPNPNTKINIHNINYYKQFWTTKGPSIVIADNSSRQIRRNADLGFDPRNIYIDLPFQQVCEKFTPLFFFGARISFAAAVGIEFSNEFAFLVT